jgi:predicted ArsR family transcriptional regulator
MQELAMLFGERAAVIADLPPVARPADAAVKGDHVRDLLARRPCTAADVAQGLGIHQNEALKYLGELLEAGEAEALRREGRTFFRLTPTRGRSTERRGP